MFSSLSWWINPPDKPYIAYYKVGRPGAYEDFVRKRAQTTLTVDSSRYEVGVWLKLHGFSELIPTMTKYTGLQLLSMTVDEEETLKASLENSLKHMMFVAIKRCRERAGISRKHIYGHMRLIPLFDNFVAVGGDRAKLTVAVSRCDKETQTSFDTVCEEVFI
jgi:hypothetical protein